MFSVQHFEIAAQDEQRASQFYRELFGWKFTAIPDLDYTMVQTAETDEQMMITQNGAINGGMFKKEPGISGPVIVITVDNTEQQLAKIEAMGGTRVMGPQQVGEMGIYAQFKDPEGNLMGLWQPLQEHGG